MNNESDYGVLLEIKSIFIFCRKFELILVLCAGTFPLLPRQFGFNYGNLLGYIRVLLTFHFCSQLFVKNSWQVRCERKVVN